MLIFVGHSYSGYTRPENYIPHYRDVEPKYPITFQFAHDELKGEHLLGDVRNLIANASACVFDLTGQSRNVMIEYGMAVALGKPHMLLLRRGGDEPVPAMLEGLRYKEYWFSGTLQQHLSSFIEEQVTHNAFPEFENMRRKAMSYIRSEDGISRYQLISALSIDTAMAGGLLQSLLASEEIVMLPNTHRYVARTALQQSA